MLKQREESSPNNRLKLPVSSISNTKDMVMNKDNSENKISEKQSHGSG